MPPGKFKTVSLTNTSDYIFVVEMNFRVDMTIRHDFSGI
jgi:hypothetical protein